MHKVIIKTMTQIIVNIEDASLLNDIKRAIAMLRGVVSIVENKNAALDSNNTTIEAINDAKDGNTIKCNSFEDYLNLVGSV